MTRFPHVNPLSPDHKNIAPCMEQSLAAGLVFRRRRDSHVRAVVQRLRGVVIEQRDALEVMRQHDAPASLHYVDPPYVHDTRGLRTRAPSYRHEMSDDQHVALIAGLRDLAGMVVLSGYRCELYDRALRGWQRIDRAAHADGARDRVESLWLSPSAGRADLFEAAA